MEDPRQAPAAARQIAEDGLVDHRQAEADGIAIFAITGVEIKNQNKITIPGSGKVSIDVRGDRRLCDPSAKRSRQRQGVQVGELSRRDADRRGSGMAPRSCRRQRQAGGAGRLTLRRRRSQVHRGDSGRRPGDGTRSTRSTGADKGSGTTTAIRLIGSAIGRGVDPCDVARQAVEWARRCSPPMDENEVLRIVSDLTRKAGDQDRGGTGGGRGGSPAGAGRVAGPRPGRLPRTRRRDRRGDRAGDAKPTPWRSWLSCSSRSGT